MEKNISVDKMLSLSKELYEKNKDKWPAMDPETGLAWVAYLVAEVGEVIDIIKKKKTEQIVSNPEVRLEMLEEIADCYMYLADILNSFHFTSEEFSLVYQEKMEKNMQRSYVSHPTKKDKESNKS
ncbi:MAG: nucleotide pyrophosphohydrolase [Candidatus Pacebacteria bacterium]|nr:nucleotide pyrophosphohydrolase [Candidatus Paceibacterota bacterium]MBP9851352.1 nucleotide pyrophosphohydrolase [Candidatus Paceibacterota bacterium]